MPVIKKRKLILEHDRSFLLPPILRVSVAPLTPTLQLRKLMSQAQALSQSRSTSGLAKTTVSTLGSLLRINSRRPCPPTDPQSSGPTRKENRVSLCFHKFNPCYPDPQFQSASRPHFFLLVTQGLVIHHFPPHQEAKTGLSPRGHFFPILTLVEYRPMTLI